MDDATCGGWGMLAVEEKMDDDDDDDGVYPLVHANEIAPTAIPNPSVSLANPIWADCWSVQLPAAAIAFQSNPRAWKGDI